MSELEDKITIRIGYDSEDFLKAKHTIIFDYKNLQVKFKISDDATKIINDNLLQRLILYKAKKRFKKALSIYHLGGYIKYNLE